MRCPECSADTRLCQCAEAERDARDARTATIAAAPDAMILLDRLEREARAGTSAAPPQANFFYDTVRAEIGRGGRVWFRINNGPRLYQARAIEALDYIEASEKRRAAIISQEQKS